MTTIPPLISASKRLRLIAIFSSLLFAISAHGEDPVDLFQQIQSLQSQMNIEITGLERIQDEKKVITRGNLEQQIEQLLVSFNHITSRNAKGQIERIVIINKKQKKNLVIGAGIN